MSSELVTKLKEWFEKASDWDRYPIIETREVIVEVVKLPPREGKTRRSPARLALHVKKSDAFRGMFIDSERVLEELVKVLSNEKVKDVVKAIEEINRVPKIFI